METRLPTDNQVFPMVPIWPLSPYFLNSHFGALGSHVSASFKLVFITLTFEDYRLFCRLPHKLDLLILHDLVQILPFGQEYQVMPCCSHSFLLGYMLFNYSIGDANLDYLIEVVSVGILHEKLPIDIL